MLTLTCMIFFLIEFFFTYNGSEWWPEHVDLQKEKKNGTKYDSLVTVL